MFGTDLLLVLRLIVVSHTLPRQHLAKQSGTVSARFTRSNVRLMAIIGAWLLPSQAA